MSKPDIKKLKADRDEAHNVYLQGVKAEAKALRDVLGKFCNSKPPIEVCEAWLIGEGEFTVADANELQSWVASNTRVSFEKFMGIGIIDAARTLLDNECAEDESDLGL